MIKSLISLLVVSVCLSIPAHAQEAAAVLSAPPVVDTQSATFREETVDSSEALSSEEFVRRSWEISSKGDANALDIVVNRCVELYGNEAALLEKELSGFPTPGQEKKYQILNDVATCLFVRAEFLMNTGKTKEAVAQFKELIATYPWAQTWDPRGWYWSIKEKSQDSIDVIEGTVTDHCGVEIEKKEFVFPSLYAPGTEEVVDYTKYGRFLNVGTENYHYSIVDVEGLSAAVGEGIYPNTGSVYNNPRYKEAKKAGRLDGNHWDFVNSDDLEAAYFKWFTAPEPWGVRLFYLGMIFERAHMYLEALKAYHALVVHFPKTIAWTYWQTPWYPSQAAIAKIRHIIRSHPGLGLEDKWMKVTVKNGFDNDSSNDVFLSYPGKIVKRSVAAKVKGMLGMDATVPTGKVVRKIGEGIVRLEQYENGHWQLLVNDAPYIIQGVTYAPTKVGQSPDKGTLKNWMFEDSDNNGHVDGPYDSWVDRNSNNVQDADEPVVGDFQLMKEMGVNTLRIYEKPDQPLNKELLRQMYEQYGIRVIVGDFLGKYAIGSGATWSEGTDYENPEHRKNMLEEVQKMVMQHKDEPYVLLWLLGNENNYGVACNADKKPEAFFQFVDEVAQWIKSVDPNHPVAVNNGDTLYLDVFAKYAPNVDIFSSNVYRGDYGFGSFWEQVLDASGRPAFISEYGCPAFVAHMTLADGEKAQEEYLRGNWMDIYENSVGQPRGVGNSLGGVLFEWLDEWWKAYEPYRHDCKSDALGPFPGGYYYEEWFGIAGQGNGQRSPFMRHLRSSYYSYQEMWTGKQSGK